MKHLRVGIWGMSELAQRVVMPLFGGAELLAPPDKGLRWQQRPGAVLDYQPAAVAQLVAVGDGNSQRLERIGRINAAPIAFEDWRLMLRQAELDGLLLTKPPQDSLGDVIEEMASRGASWLWLNFPAATSAEAILTLREHAAARGVCVWWAQPALLLRAHRAALGVLARGELGALKNVTLNWPAPFAAPSSGKAIWWEAAQAINLCLHMAASTSGALPRALQIEASKKGASVCAEMRLSNDVVATINFKAPQPLWPRLEVAGSKGTLLCEGGRDLYCHTESSEIEHHSSGWSVDDAGTLHGAYAEDMRRFLARCAAMSATSDDHSWRAATFAVQAASGATDSLQENAMKNLPPLHLENLSAKSKQEAVSLTAPSRLPFH